MIVRIWKVGIQSGKKQALEKFAKEISLPMFRSQAGCLGVLFTYKDDICATVTLWNNQASINQLEQSSIYQEVVEKIENSGILEGNHETEVFYSYGGFLNAEVINSNL